MTTYLANFIELGSNYIRATGTLGRVLALARPTLAPALLRSRRPGVGFCYLATPRNEVGRGIVAINDAFDQRRPVIVGDRHFDGFLKFLAVSGAQAASMTILGITEQFIS